MRRNEIFKRIENLKKDLKDYNKDIITLNIKSLSGEKINFGDTVIITDETPTKHYYLVTKHITLNSF